MLLQLNIKCLLFAASDVFAVDESSTDHHSSFVEHFKINFSNIDVSTFTIAQGLETFEIKFYRNCTNNGGKPTSDVCATVKLLACQRYSMELVIKFGFKILDNNYTWLFKNLAYSSTLGLYDIKTYNLTSRDYVMNPANRALEGGTLTIRTSGSYIVNDYHYIRPQEAKFKQGVHTSVDMSYTWTLRNLTLPMNATNSVVSAVFFAKLGAAEFFINMYPGTKVDSFVTIYTTLQTAPRTITFSLQVNYTYELIDNA
jgi:hypothetical protein